MDKMNDDIQLLKDVVEKLETFVDALLDIVKEIQEDAEKTSDDEPDSD